MQELIREYGKAPLSYGLIDREEATTVTAVNTACGEVITLSAILKDGRICEIGWVGEGRMIMRAAMSILAEQLVEMSTGSIADWDCERLVTELEVEMSDVPLRTRKSLVTALYAFWLLHAQVHDEQIPTLMELINGCEAV